ncbi:MAG: hypothetical protein M3Z06_06395 [Actinomycetota bacterium]|nr:hypothetical protein [Actinomycetota bacterium]
MQSAFETVIWVVCGLGVVIGVATLIYSGRAWDDYGKDRLVMDHELSTGPKQGSAAATVERDDEIRQLLEARNARRARRGQAPVDVEDELRRLTLPQIDADLCEEIRDMVIARNHRRARTGKPPLDVDAEVARQISELSGA